MSITTRMLPLGGATVTGNIGAGAGSPIQRSYSATAGGFIDALGDPSADAATLASQDFIPIGGSGTTAQRPNGAGFLKPGFVYVDTTLGLVVVWDGLNWRNPVTAATA
jgi:hypothetical protein